MNDHSTTKQKSLKIPPGILLLESAQFTIIGILNKSMGARLLNLIKQQEIHKLIYKIWIYIIKRL